MIFIASAGRSGSAWLSTVFTALGLKVRHEWYPGIDNPDVIADTSWIWSRGDLIDRLKTRNTPGTKDTLILLERPRKEIENSVAKLINRDENWDRLFQEWEQLKKGIFDAGLTQILRSTHRIQYADLFKAGFKDTLRSILGVSGYKDKQEQVDRVWEFMRHMNVRNSTAERDCRASYGPIQN